MGKCYKCGSENIMYVRYYPYIVWYENGEEKKMPYSRPYLEQQYRCIDCGNFLKIEGKFNVGNNT